MTHLGSAEDRTGMSHNRALSSLGVNGMVSVGWDTHSATKSEFHLKKDRSDASSDAFPSGSK